MLAVTLQLAIRDARGNPVRSRLPDSFDSLMRFLLTVISDRGEATLQDAVDALRGRLANYVRRHGADLARTLDVERRFEIPLDGTRLRGRIDLLLRVAGPDSSAVEIVDIKTAENRPPLPQHQNQLRLYARAARTLGLNPVGLAIHDLDSEEGAAIPVEEDPRELGAFEEDMCRWVHGIRRGRFSSLSGTGCRTCDYTGLC
ncbi:MAG: PD-(D/E)XK nuclease family protein [Bacillota bacterium]